MPRATWLLRNGQPVIEIQLHDPVGFTHSRVLLADTGAGPRYAPFELVLSEIDCKNPNGQQSDEVGLGGSIQGRFSIHRVRIKIPILNLKKDIAAVGVPVSQLPSGLDGIASFKFLNSFTYGNFGDPNQFGLETS